jgi:hypothetical protein
MLYLYITSDPVAIINRRNDRMAAKEEKLTLDYVPAIAFEQRMTMGMVSVIAKELGTTIFKLHNEPISLKSNIGEIQLMAKSLLLDQDR